MALCKNISGRITTKSYQNIDHVHPNNKIKTNKPIRIHQLIDLKKKYLSQENDVYVEVKTLRLNKSIL